MRFDPQSGFMPQGGGETPTPGHRSSGDSRPPRAGLRPGVILLVLTVTSVLGVWMWRETVQGPSTASADQLLNYMPDWLRNSLDAGDADEETTVLSASSTSDDPGRSDGDSDVADAGDPDASAADAATESIEGQSQPEGDNDQAATGERPHLTIIDNGDDEVQDEPNDTTSSSGGYGLSFQPPFQAQQAFDKGMARSYYGRHQEAVEHFRRAIAIDPEFAEARFRLGVSLLKLDDVQGAKAQYRELQDLHAEYAEKLKRLLPE